MNVKAQRPAKSVEPSSSADHDQESRTPAQPISPATLAMPVIKPKYPAAELIRLALKGAIARIQAADPEARRGEPEGIHRMRTSTRRLRSELRAVADLVDHAWSEHLEQELKWLAAELGNVRDLDILCQGLRAAAPSATGNGQASGSPCANAQESTLGPLFIALQDRHAENSRDLCDELQGARYRQLMASLAAAVESPVLKDEARRPCRKALPPLVTAAWRHLRKGGKALEEDSPDADFHHVRKLAKRARYAAELIAPALGSTREKHSQRFIRLTTEIQDILGEHQDATVAISELEKYLAGPPRDSEFSRQVRDLLETRHQIAQATRAKFFKVWKKLDRKKSLRWFKSKQKMSSSTS